MGYAIPARIGWPHPFTLSITFSTTAIDTGDILTIYDADMTVPAPEMSKFYDAIVSNKGDFINGSRLIYPLEKESMRIINFFGNRFFSLAFSWILGQPLKDTLCGTKVIWREDYEKVIKRQGLFWRLRSVRRL
jgi:hypothetical protein